MRVWINGIRFNRISAHHWYGQHPEIGDIDLRRHSDKDVQRTKTQRAKGTYIPLGGWVVRHNGKLIGDKYATFKDASRFLVRFLPAQTLTFLNHSIHEFFSTNKRWTISNRSSPNHPYNPDTYLAAYVLRYEGKRIYAFRGPPTNAMRVATWIAQNGMQSEYLNCTPMMGKLLEELSKDVHYHRMSRAHYADIKMPFTWMYPV